MEITVEHTYTIEAEKVTSPSQITKEVRLFYELGKYNGVQVEDNWQRSGVFKEIDDVSRFIENDPRLQDIDFITHHNFHIKNKR